MPQAIALDWLIKNLSFPAIRVVVSIPCNKKSDGRDGLFSLPIVLIHSG